LKRGVENISGNFLSKKTVNPNSATSTGELRHAVAGKKASFGYKVRRDFKEIRQSLSFFLAYSKEK
jgi:hypothetical protein